MTLAPSPTAPGNSAKDQTYVWDAWNRLVEVLEGETTLATYEYDGLHRRIKKTVDGTNHHYYLSEQNQILEEQTQTGMGAAEVLNEFVWYPYYVDALAARWDNTGESAVYYHALHDGNFNVTAVINGSADVQERYHYTPYGQTSFLDGSFANPAGASGIGQENLYTGRQIDPETGLYYFRARHYHSAIGRFVSRDPLEYFSSQSLYAATFVPNGVDPSGLVGTHPGADSSADECNRWRGRCSDDCRKDGLRLGPKQASAEWRFRRHRVAGAGRSFGVRLAGESLA